MGSYFACKLEIKSHITDHKYDCLLNEDRDGWLKEEEFWPIIEKINMLRGNQIVIPGQQFQQIIRYIDEEMTRKIFKQTQRTQDNRKKEIDRILTKIYIKDFEDILTKVGQILNCRKSSWKSENGKRMKIFEVSRQNKINEEHSQHPSWENDLMTCF